MNKRKVVTMTLLTAALVAGLALAAGCNKDTATDPFTGVWAYTASGGSATFTFAAPNWTLTTSGIPEVPTSVNGTYTQTNSVATLKSASSENAQDTVQAKISGNQLTTDFIPGITFTKR
jgi:hypothetical protein